VTCSTTNGDNDGSRADGASKGDKTAELLHEATQLLKRLRVPMNPKLMVMQLSNIETVDDEYILLDSGVTHALRPARDADEWQKSEGTPVQLADGTTEMFRLKKGTKILLAEPSAQVSWIIPWAASLTWTFRWSGVMAYASSEMTRAVKSVWSSEMDAL
jgi:hypothetical protein